jgi:hypothetical protein
MKNQILEELKESGHGFIEFEGYHDVEEGNIEIGVPCYTAGYERAAKLYLMSCYGFTEDQSRAFWDWYISEIEGDGLEFDIVEYSFSEEVAWFLEGWNMEQIRGIRLGLINIQNVDAQKEPWPKGTNYCWSER